MSSQPGRPTDSTDLVDGPPRPPLPPPEPGLLGRLTQPAMWAVGVGVGLAYLSRQDPNVPGHYPTCPSLALTGLYCPGCGSLRATWDLMHGDLAGALARNPIAPFVELFLVIVFLRWVVARWRGVPVPMSPRPWVPYAVAAAVVVYTIARNVPGWTWLSPA